MKTLLLAAAASAALVVPAGAASIDDALRALFNGPGPSAVVYWETGHSQPRVRWEEYRLYSPAFRLTYFARPGENPFPGTPRVHPERFVWHLPEGATYWTGARFEQHWSMP